MKIRFLEMVESDVRGFPFMPGQVIDVERVSDAVAAAITDGRAELIRIEEPEIAITEAPERAVTRGRKHS
jgi:hypothetical protein